MPPPRLPRYVQRVNAKGRAYLYFRHGGRQIRRLPDDVDSAEFHEAYAATLRSLTAAPTLIRQPEGTVGWLIESYKASPEFMSKAATTRVSYDRELERLAPIRAFPAVEVRRRHINAIRDKLADKPRTRHLFGQVCSLLFNYGVRELDLDMLNPARLMARDGEAQSYLPWSEAQMAAFEAGSPPPHVMTAYMIARYTGPRRGDAVELSRAHYDGRRLAIGGAKTGNPIAVLCHPRLRAYLDALPATLRLISDEIGRPVTAGRLTKDMRRYLDGLGLRELHLHGLRHTAGTALAEAGCSTHEIAAVLGHETLQMVERYTKKARQKTLADAAVTKLERTGTKRHAVKPR